MTTQQITSKIITPTGYIKRGTTGEEQYIEKPLANIEKEKKRSSRAELSVMRDKMMSELCNLLKTQHNATRIEIYKIMEEEGFLPIVGGDKVMGYARFKTYYSDARSSLGISSFTGSKSEYILANYKTKNVKRIAEHIESKEIYVRQVIYRFKKRGIIK